MYATEWVVFDEFYRGLRLNGWSKEWACAASRRHTARMSARKLRKDATRINAEFNARFDAEAREAKNV